MENGTLSVPNDPIIHYIEGDGIGVDITPVMIDVVNAAVDKAYGGEKSIVWSEVLAGEKAFNATGEWLPQATLDAMKTGLVSIKGPLTTPVGGGIRSLNVALRQKLDLYACVRPVRWYDGTPSPFAHPKTSTWSFSEKTVKTSMLALNGKPKATVPSRSLISSKTSWALIKFDSPTPRGLASSRSRKRDGSYRSSRHSIRHRQRPAKRDLVHKGNIMKFTEGGFRDWGYTLAKEEFGATELDGGPWCTLTNPHTGNTIVIKDVIADAMLQQIITRPAEYSVLTTMNLNGDYISDALAAQVGGIGIAPGANINYDTGISIFEATHGTAPKYAGQDKVNPGSLILSAEMMLRHMGWKEAADLIVKGMEGAISNKTVTYDFERLMDDATLLSCSAFGAAMIQHM